MNTKSICWLVWVLFLVVVSWEVFYLRSCWCLSVFRASCLTSKKNADAAFAYIGWHACSRGVEQSTVI